MKSKIKISIAVKAFIINNKNKLLTIKRSSKDNFQPNTWEFPGGKLEDGEDPHKGLIREIKEEIGLKIEIIQPLNIQHFTIKQEKRIITMIIFYCKTKSNKLKLSDEHSDYQWINLNEAKKLITPHFHKEIEIYTKRIKK